MGLKICSAWMGIIGITYFYIGYFTELSNVEVAAYAVISNVWMAGAVLVWALSNYKGE